MVMKVRFIDPGSPQGELLVHFELPNAAFILPLSVAVRFRDAIDHEIQRAREYVEGRQSDVPLTGDAVRIETTVAQLMADLRQTQISQQSEEVIE